MGRLLLFVLPFVLAESPAVAATAEGRWRLVEQHYGEGLANLAVSGRPVRLEFVLEGGQLQGWIWPGDERDAALSWPAFLTDAGPLPVELVQRSVDASLSVVVARYRVRPSPAGDLVLEIHERYKLSGDGRSLAGVLEVSFTGGVMNRGGFVLRRRFERER
jgi:hypothetical protein